MAYLSSCRLAVFLGFLLASSYASAVVVHGRVTDSLGRPISNATVALVQNGKVISSRGTAYDGSYQISTAATGHFNVLAGGGSLRQVSTRSFYGSTFDSIEENVVLEPEWVRESIVMSATGVPQPEAQSSASITVLPKSDFVNRADMIDALRQVPGINVVQEGQRGSMASVFIRGGNADASSVLLDGIPIEDIGGGFDFSSLATTGIATAEAYRGSNSVLWGSNAAAGVLHFTTPHGTTSFPSLFYEGDAGNFGTYRNEAQLAGTWRKLDYYGGFADLQSSNSQPMDEYHNITSVANLGYAVSGATSVRVIARNADLATGLPGTTSFFGMSNDGKRSDQNIYLSGSIDHTFSDAWQGFVRYGLARKREESQQWYPAGNLIEGNYYGDLVNITGANGYQVQGQALMNYGGIYPYKRDLASDRDNLYAQTEYKFTSYLTAIACFRYEDERGMENESSSGFDENLERANYDYMLAVNGKYKQRLFYSLGGNLQHDQLYGTEGNPRVGLSYYVIQPAKGKFHGTKLNFNFSKGVKEPSIEDQFGSLYSFLQANGGQPAITQFHIMPIGAEEARTFDGGAEQSLFSERVILRATYFHNEFGNQVESAGTNLIPQFLPQLSPGEQQAIQKFLQSEGSSALTLNSLAFRAQGLESEIDYGLGRSIYMRGGYTYLDAQVQHSFASDVAGPSFNPRFPQIPIGNVSPLAGARPFQRPRHTGFASISYAGSRLSLIGTGSFASHSDDSTYLGGQDPFGENTLLLPNHNLDHAYAKLDAGGTLQVTSWLSIYTQLDNLLTQKHIAPIGYPSLPFNARTGLRFTLGHPKKNQ